MNKLFRILAVVFSAVLLGFASAQASQCGDVAAGDLSDGMSREEFASYIGEEGHSYTLPAGAAVYEAGSGMTGVVFEVVEKTGAEYALKFYRTYGPSVGALIRGETFLTTDLKRLQILKTLSAQIAQPQDRFQFVDAQQLGPRILRRQYVRGQKLSTLRSQDPALNSQIEPIYRRKLMALHSRIHANGAWVLRELGQTPDLETYETVGEHAQDMFALSMRNTVLQDSTNALVIVDPK